MGARWRGSGHGYYFLLRKFYWRKNWKTTQQGRLPLSRPRGGL